MQIGRSRVDGERSRRTKVPHRRRFRAANGRQLPGALLADHALGAVAHQVGNVFERGNNTLLSIDDVKEYSN